MPLNTAGLAPSAFVFDPRGYALSGATTQFKATPEANETGAISFANGGFVATSTKGFTGVSATVTAAGKISFAVSLQEARLISAQSAGSLMALEVSTLEPIGKASPSIETFDWETETFRVTFGKTERLDQAPPEAAPVEYRRSSSSVIPSGARNLGGGSQSSPLAPRDPVRRSLRPLGTVLIRCITPPASPRGSWPLTQATPTRPRRAQLLGARAAGCA